MRLRFVLLLLGIAACGNSHDAVPTAPVNSSAIRALTWNVQQSSGSRADQQIDLIASTHPDVVVLQEAYRGEVEHFRAGLASRTGRSWDARYAPVVRRPDRNEGAGVVLLSALPASASDSTQMPSVDAWSESRPVLRTRVDVGGASVDVVTTHLSAGEQGRGSREQQVRQLVAWATAGGRPVIIGGDFNAEPSSAEISLIRATCADAWKELGRSGGETFASANPTRRIDYWFSARSGRPLVPIDATVVQACRAGACLSDHNAFLVVFER